MKTKTGFLIYLIYVAKDEQLDFLLYAFRLYLETYMNRGVNNRDEPETDENLRKRLLNLIEKLE